jgi:hypothetical protein
MPSTTSVCAPNMPCCWRHVSSLALLSLPLNCPPLPPLFPQVLAGGARECGAAVERSSRPAPLCAVSSGSFPALDWRHPPPPPPRRAAGQRCRCRRRHSRFEYSACVPHTAVGVATPPPLAEWEAHPFHPRAAFRRASWATGGCPCVPALACSPSLPPSSCWPLSGQAVL